MTPEIAVTPRCPPPTANSPITTACAPSMPAEVRTTGRVGARSTTPCCATRRAPRTRTTHAGTCLADGATRAGTPTGAASSTTPHPTTTPATSRGIHAAPLTALRPTPVPHPPGSSAPPPVSSAGRPPGSGARSTPAAHQLLLRHQVHLPIPRTTSMHHKSHERKGTTPATFPHLGASEQPGSPARPRLDTWTTARTASSNMPGSSTTRPVSGPSQTRTRLQHRAWRTRCAPQLPGAARPQRCKGRQRLRTRL